MLTLPHMSHLAPSDQGQLRLDTLTKLRWLAVAGQTASVLFVHFVLHFTLPLLACLSVIALLVVVNLFSRAFFPATTRLSATTALIYLIFDIAQLSVLIYLTGGLTNPFSILFMVPVMVSASSLFPRQTLFLGALVLTVAAILAGWHQPLPWNSSETYDPPLLIIVGEWLSLAAAMGFMGLHVFRISRERQQLSDALAATELALAQEQHLSQLDGLAAAAAHALGTPLATIALVAKELANDERVASSHGDDMALLREQVSRCRDIMGRLTSLGSPADIPFHQAPLSHLLEEIAEPHRHFGINVVVTAEGEGEEPFGRRDPALLYGLGNLIENAVDFANSEVDIKMRWTENRLSVLIADDGPGIRPDILQRLGEPYVTSRPGQDDAGGLGLGFFIAKRLIERLGGRIALANRLPPERGAQVKIDWARSTFEAEHPLSPAAAI